MARVQQLGQSLESAIAQYQYATVRLNQIHHDQQVNRRELAIARTDLHASQKTIDRRLVSLYRGNQVSTLEVILGAKNLDDMLNRLNTEKSVTRLDTSVLKQITSSRATDAGERTQSREREPPAGSDRGGARGEEAADRVEPRRAASPALVDQGPDRADRGGPARRAGEARARR